MKLHKTIYSLVVSALMLGTAACDGEKDLIIIDGDLPIKTQTLYMVGDATPNGWSIDSPTPLTPSEEDPLVFTWEGNLYAGEMKLCLTPGSWDVGFIRPMNSGDEIGTADITDAPFQMHAGDPDEKWRVTEAGTYRLVFDLRNWKMSTKYLAGPPAPDKTPIEAEALFIVGDATPNGWNIDAPTQLTKTADYIFEYDGELHAGEMKACTTAGSWDVSFIRPTSGGVKISKSGVEDSEFVYTAGPDDKWSVADAGIYHLVFNLKDYTITAEYKGEIPSQGGDKDPIETETLYMIGDATPNGWSMDNATEFTKSADNQYIFTWEGTLTEGSMKACIVKDGNFACPFLRPAAPGVEISEKGVASPEFVFTTSPDDQWRVTKAGTYRLTFNLKDYTLTAEYKENAQGDKDPIETSTLYMIGDATPNGWSMDNATEFTRLEDNQYLFVWEGNLTEGNMKACLEKDGSFSCAFLRPSTSGVEISEKGVAAPDFVFTHDPDDQWRVVKAGKYRITFDLKAWTISATYLQ